MKTKPDEFSGMASLYALLKPYDADQRARMLSAVHAKLLEDQPKKRVRKPKSNVLQLTQDAASR